MSPNVPWDEDAKGTKMNYEISNVVFNHKPTKWEITHRNPFHATKKNKVGNEFFLVSDAPQNLFKVFQLGHCIKPHAPTNTKLAIAHTIILDFDNLTKEQCDFIKAIVNGAYGFKDGMCGDYSAGTKARLHENKDIADYILPKWGYKVFYPIERVVMKEEIYDAFLEAVAFFNPTFSMDEVERVFKAWVKCNNNKKRDDMLKVSDPIFKGWILPDVAMLNSFRTQITYGVNVEQREKFNVIDDMTISRHASSMSKFPSTGKKDWCQGLWEANDIKEDAKCDSKDESNKRTMEKILGMLKDSTFTQDPIHLPTSRPQFAQMLGMTTFNDLVLPHEDIRHLMAACWGKSKNLSIDIYKMKLDANAIGKTMARLAYELRFQDTKGRFKDRIPNWMVEDCISFFKSIHGMNVFTILDKKQANVVLEAMARSIVKAISTYKDWRTRQKLKATLSDPIVIEAREKWRMTKDGEDGKAYFKLLENDIQKRMGNPPKIPYAYRRRGLKKEMIHRALNNLVMLPTIQDWIEWVKKNLNKGDGIFTDDVIGSWYREYREKWNETHESDKINHKHHKSKWSETFKGKSYDEIEEIIKDIPSKQTRCRLRKEYLRS
jgi:hypothetical protein